MAQMGMDVDLVEQAGRDLQNRASSIQSIIAGLDKTVSSLSGEWDGRDAQVFVNEWWPEHKKALLAASQSVAGLGQSALNNASEQREASGAGSSIAAASAAVAAGSLAAAIPASAPNSPLADKPGGLVGELSPGGGKNAYEAFAAQTSHQVRGVDYLVDGNGAAVENCTAWAAFRRHELGLSVASPPGNGYQMAGNVGGTTSTPPSLGALVSYGGSTNGGHVMVVEQMISPKEFRVSEMNYGGLGKMHTTTVWTQSENGSWASNDGRIERSLTISA